MTSDDARRTDLLAANAAFYLAFFDGNMAAMAELWGRGDVSCIHPGWPALIGREQVLESWRGILESPQRPVVQCRNVLALVHENEGRVVCTEIIESANFATTNYFRYINGHWRLMHHQASPISDMSGA